MSPALPSLEGLPANKWTWTVRRAVCLARGGLSLEEAAKKSKADLGRVKEAWAVYSETPEGKSRIAANARVKILGAEERAKVEAELRARDGAPALRAEVEQLHLDLRGLQKDYDGLRASLESEAERARALEAERDAAREEVGQLRAALADVSSLRAAEQRAALDAAEAQRRAQAQFGGAALEIMRLAAQVRGIEEITIAVARIEAALAEGVKTQPSKLAAAVAQESAEEVAQLRAELAARTKERDASRAAMADLLCERQTSTPSAPRSSTCSTKGCGAPSKVKGLCMRCYKREWSARKAASR